MSKTIPVEQLPHEAKRLLSAAWEDHESVMLERNGEPVAAVVPMEEYRRWHPEPARAKGEPRKAESRKGKADGMAELATAPLAYELPADVLAQYHHLLDKKFNEGLTPDEEAELERVDKELDAADLAMPLGQYISSKAEREHARRMAKLDELIAKLKELQASP
jgi:antitoxin (DNA-binding transcriptional repressor) of toxin-antitoxin stability system